MSSSFRKSLLKALIPLIIGALGTGGAIQFKVEYEKPRKQEEMGRFIVSLVKGAQSVCTGTGSPNGEVVPGDELQ